MVAHPRKSHVILLAGLILGISLGLGTLAQAMPPHPDLLASDDPLAKRCIALYDSLRHNPAGPGIDQPDPIAAGSAATGSRKLLVILVRFSDHDSSVA